MASVTVHCPRCQSAHVYRHGQNPKGYARFRCRDCHRVFQLSYAYEARKAGVKEQITEMAFNSAGVVTTRKQAVYWPTLWGHELMKPVANYWRYSHPLTLVC